MQGPVLRTSIQEAALRAAGCETICFEKNGDVVEDREEILDQLKPGDVLRGHGHRQGAWDRQGDRRSDVVSDIPEQKEPSNVVSGFFDRVDFGWHSLWIGAPDRQPGQFR